MKLFVTGHTGFKGAWAIALFRRLGADVAGYALAPPTNPSLFAEASLANRVTHVEGDVRDANGVREAMAAAAPDAVLHMAAQSLVLRGLADPGETFSTNVLGTANVLEAVRSVPSVRAVVVVTSDKCYEPSSRPLREGDPLGGRDPYSASKACAEIVVEGYRRFLDDRAVVATVRAGNVIGGGDWAADRLLADLARAMAGDGTLALRNPGAVRPWQHVLDALWGYELVLRRALDGDRSVAGAWNFGPADSGHVTVADVVASFEAVYGRRLHVRVDERAPAENPALLLDSSRARSELGWHPAYDVAAAIAETAEFYRARAAGEPAAALLDAAVERYCGAAVSPQGSAT